MKQKSIAFDAHTHKQIERHAKSESRSFNNMTNVLLKEALAARERNKEKR